MQLGRLAGLEMYGTCSARSAGAVSNLGAVPIDYRHQDVGKEILRLAPEGMDVVFDPIAEATSGIHAKRSVLAASWLTAIRARYVGKIVLVPGRLSHKLGAA